MPKPRIFYRRADTGKITTKKYATDHPNTTVKEIIIVKTPPKTTKKNK